MVAGKDAPSFGEAKNSWLTGTAAWTFSSISEYILGIRPELEGLRVNPVIPASWNSFEVTRRYRGTTYRICVDNPSHAEHGIVFAEIDGKEIEISQDRTVILPVLQKTDAEVRIVMG